jgi:hypothetical protein
MSLTLVLGYLAISLQVHSKLYCERLAILYVRTAMQ